ncbi:hypothetical protein CBR_g23732 [Chara braunii]|uniref:C2H2-type domain-containing protein n=1 Tax=Chara braunii TaxID=69332 RepID=A0A388JVM6_CHABU|nr:hypothetical protein CBR_g23732 [Chara braunii]|eukprot:GBG61772.1 hypothetical protein CBR_g23732 [Chara braunii]
MEKTAVQVQGKSWADVIRNPVPTIVKELEERGSENLTGFGKPTGSGNVTSSETGSGNPTGSATDDAEVCKGRPWSQNQSMASTDDKEGRGVASCRFPTARCKEGNDEDRRHSNWNVNTDQNDSEKKAKEKAGKGRSKKVGLEEKSRSASCSFRSSGKGTLDAAAFSPRSPAEETIAQRSQTGARWPNLPKYWADIAPHGGDMLRPAEGDGVASCRFPRARYNKTNDQNRSHNNQSFNSDENGSGNQKKTKAGSSKTLQVEEKTRSTCLSSRSSGKGTADAAASSSCSLAEERTMSRRSEMGARRLNVATCLADITPPADDTLRLSNTAKGARTEWLTSSQAAPCTRYFDATCLADITPPDDDILRPSNTALPRDNVGGGSSRVQSLECQSNTRRGEGTASTTKRKDQDAVFKRSVAEAQKSPLDAHRLVKCLSCGKTFKGYGSLQNHLFSKHDGYNSLSRRAAEAKLLQDLPEMTLMLFKGPAKH